MLRKLVNGNYISQIVAARIDLCAEIYSDEDDAIIARMCEGKRGKKNKSTKSEPVAREMRH